MIFNLRQRVLKGGWYPDSMVPEIFHRTYSNHSVFKLHLI